MDRFRLFKWTFLIQELPVLRLEPGSIVSSNLVLIPPHLTLWTLPSHRSGLLFTHHGRYLAKFNLALETSRRSTGKFMSVSVARLFWLDGCYGNESLHVHLAQQLSSHLGCLYLDVVLTAFLNSCQYVPATLWVMVQAVGSLLSTGRTRGNSNPLVLL